MDHEVDDAAAVQGTKLSGLHAEEALVVRQELAGRSQEQGEQAGREQAESQYEQERPAIPDRRLEEAPVVGVSGAHGGNPCQSCRCVAATLRQEGDVHARRQASVSTAISYPGITSRSPPSPTSTTYPSIEWTTLKDEGPRLLGSFNVLGGRYAGLRALVPRSACPTSRPWLRRSDRVKACRR